MRKIIWLFGENEGRTLNNNSFYFWKHVCKIDDEIEKYFVVKLTRENYKKVRSLSKEERKRILWKSFPKHWIKFFKSNTHFVSLSYRDVTPAIFKKTMNITKPIVYLQHGTLGIKRIGYQGNGYHNKFLRFFIYNEKMLKIFSEKNNFKPYQLYYSKYHPRYMELVRRNNLEKKNRQFLYFLTWREYFGNNKETNNFVENITKLVLDERLNNYLKENNIKFKLCVHQFFDAEKLKTVYEKMNTELFEIVTPKQIDVMDELAYSELLITDFSSVGFDFTFLGKPVLLYAPDFEEYLKERKLYCSKQELKNNMSLSVESLVDKIINGNYKVNNFFRSRLPKKIDYKYVLEGKHIDKIYNDYRNMELNKIVFLGYRFGGRGGSVSASKALAEGLLQKGYYVEMASLKGNYTTSNFPYGLREARISFKSRMILFRAYEKICMILNCLHLDKGPFKYDSSKDFLPFNIKRRLNNYLKNCTAKTIISTRESIHPFLCETKNDYLKNKVYFFHTELDAFKKIFKGLDNVLKEYEYDKVLFVSKASQEKYNEEYNFKINTQKVLGNTLTMDKIVARDDIKACGTKKQYKGICLFRLSNERKEDIKKLIKFGLYLKDKKNYKYIIDVYGNGTLEDYLKDEIKSNKLSRIIKYKGVTDNPFKETRKHDFIIDFSKYQSFGMIYLESILAGKKLYAASNSGSNEVLSDISENIYSDFDDLYNKLLKLNKVTDKQLKKYYDIILNKYGPQKLADDFIDILD